MSDPCPTVDPDGVPNLDAMEDDELRAFFYAHQLGGNYEALFHAAVVGITPAKEAAHRLSLYAWHLGVARLARRDGDIQRAELYEALAQRIYDMLPTWARW